MKKLKNATNINGNTQNIECPIPLCLPINLSNTSGKTDIHPANTMPKITLSKFNKYANIKKNNTAPAICVYSLILVLQHTSMF